MTRRRPLGSILAGYLGCGPSEREVDNDLALLDAKFDEARSRMNEGTRIRIYAVTDGEWWAADSLDSAIAAAAKDWGLHELEVALIFGGAHELSDVEMQALRFTDCFDCRTFAEVLESRVAARSQFPQHFASRDHIE